MDQILLADWVADGIETGRDALVARLAAIAARAFGQLAGGGAHRRGREA